MAEFGRNGSYPICHRTEDVRNWSNTEIASEMLTSALAIVLLVKAFIPLALIIGLLGNIAFILL